MGMLWQSCDHAMTDQKSRQIKNNSTVEMPPSYELLANQPALSHHKAPTSPLTGLYPTLQVTGGEVCGVPFRTETIFSLTHTTKTVAYITIDTVTHTHKIKITHIYY
ncbi:hypothetical protein AMECASPLE_032864 [Ameca splendens]|uniref:Uncharacterized protein n=1 Tax=Ameca splendens TaxID=208324 RepID=A0ABV0ZHC8_9TELE